MGLSYDDAVRCGIGALHPDAPGNRSARPSSPPAFDPRSCSGDRPSRRRHEPGKPNKLEARFGDHLELAKLAGRIVEYRYEPFKWRLAPRTWYTVDYAITFASRPPIIIDVKAIGKDGRIRLEDDAACKVKVAASMYPEWPLYLVAKVKGGWEYREVGKSGIGGWCQEPF